MAISKKYSRRIVVDGIAYRWRVLPRVEHNPPAYDGHYDGHIVANVWPEDHPGQRLRLIGGYPHSETGLPTDSVTPRLVAEGIRAAHQAGRVSASRQGTFQIHLPRAET